LSVLREVPIPPYSREGGSSGHVLSPGVPWWVGPMDFNMKAEGQEHILQEISLVQSQIKIVKACSFGGSLFHPPHLWLMSRLHIPDPCIPKPQDHYISRNKGSKISKSLENKRGGEEGAILKKLLPPRSGQFSECPTWMPATTWRSVYKVRVGILCDLNQSISKLGTEG
jgi:hypothetical protein